MNKNIDDLLIGILEINYLQLWGRLPGIENEYNRDLYPFNWYDFSTEKKCKILAEAIQYKKKIVETNCYQQLMEDVKFSK